METLDGVLEEALPPPSPTCSQLSNRDLEVYLDPVDKEVDRGSPMVDRPLPETPPVCAKDGTFTVDRREFYNQLYNTQYMPGYLQLDESKISEIGVSADSIKDMYLRTQWRYHNPVEYSYTDMDSNNSQPRTPAMERLVSGNGSTQSGASGDSRDLYFDTNHNDRPPSAYRKRENPLYDSADQVRQSTVEEKSSKQSLCSCPFIIIIFFSIVAVCAFILAALAISGIGVSTTREATLVTPSSHLQKALERIDKLEQQYANLLEKLNQVSVDAEEIQRLKANVTAQNVKIQQLEDRIEVIRTTTNNNIMRFERNVTSRLDTISKTPGPPGAGNLSACEHRKLSFGGSSDIPQSYTSYFPNTIAEFNQWALMGVECAVSGGTYSAVEVSESQGFKQFRCNCSGKTSASNRFCYMHYWRCPRIS